MHPCTCHHYYTYNKNGKVCEVIAATLEGGVPNPHCGAAISDPVLNEEVPRGTSGSLEVGLRTKKRKHVIDKTVIPIQAVATYHYHYRYLKWSAHRDIVGEGE